MNKDFDSWNKHKKEVNSKRLVNKMAKLDEEAFDKIRKAVKDFL